MGMEVCPTYMKEGRTIKAGAVIMGGADRSRIALLYRCRQRDWTFPKGHMEAGEDSAAAMMREVREETGLRVRIRKVLPDLRYPHSDGGTIDVRMYLVESLDDSLLKAESDGDIVEWVEGGDVAGRLSHENLKRYFSDIASRYRLTR